jgi:hypothetical protein
MHPPLIHTDVLPLHHFPNNLDSHGQQPLQFLKDSKDQFLIEIISMDQEMKLGHRP